MTPCVYVARDGRPCFFVGAASVAQAVSIATGLKGYFGISAWVAGWREIAHQPQPLDLELERARAGVEGT